MSHADTSERKPHRAKIFWIERDRLIAVISGAVEIVGWPADARVISVMPDWGRCQIGVMIESETFGDVPDGEQVPEIELGVIDYKTIELGENRAGFSHLGFSHLGFSHLVVKQNAERIELPDGRVKWREFL